MAGRVGGPLWAGDSVVSGKAAATSTVWLLVSRATASSGRRDPSRGAVLVAIPGSGTSGLSASASASAVRKM